VEPLCELNSAHLPNADQKIVFDQFHTAKHRSEPVDQVRRKEHKQLRAGDDRLAGTRYDWRAATHQRPGPQGVRRVTRQQAETAWAWALKEAMMQFFSYWYERPTASPVWKTELACGSMEV
jgi:hypothetical protein